MYPSGQPWMTSRSLMPAIGTKCFVSGMQLMKLCKCMLTSAEGAECGENSRFEGQLLFIIAFNVRKRSIHACSQPP